MGDKTGIEWTDATWNPVTGCDRCSPGCRECYALTMAKRLKAMGSPKYQNDGDPDTSGPGFGVTCHPAELETPHRWRKPRRVFVCSMSDLFHPDVPDGFIMAVWWVMMHNPQHTFQVLTKRPKRTASFLRRMHDVAGEELSEFKDARGPEAVRAAHPSGRGQLFADMLEQWGEPPEGAAYPKFDWMEGFGRWGGHMMTHATSNIWIGTTIESSDYLWRAKALVDAPTTSVRFLSVEPMLGPVDLSPWLDRIGWVIAGGESGPGARPMHPDWVRALRDQCVDAAVPFLFKQWGEWSPESMWKHRGHEAAGFLDADGLWRPFVDGTGKPGRPPMARGDAITMRRAGKKAADRELDGRRWDEFPAAAS